MKKILISLIFLLALLFFPSQASAADCSINLANRATIKEGDQPIFVITNTSSETRKFFIRFQPVGYGSLPRGYQICHNPTKGIDLILDPGETKRIEGRALNPLRVPSVVPGVEKVTKTFKLQGFLHTNDQCGETTISGHLRCEGDDFTLQPPTGEIEGACKMFINKEAVRPGELFDITVINPDENTEKISFFIEVQKPGIGPSNKYPLSPFPLAKTLEPGQRYTWSHALEGKATETPQNVYIRAKAYPKIGLRETFCQDVILFTLSPEKITSLLEVFRPQPCLGGKGIKTALGCIPTDIRLFVSWLLKYAISIAGGIAFLLIIFSAFQMITSSGNPEQLEKAKQMLGSAIAGLLFIIFAVFLLRIIGVEILDIF